jgi:hypothetical protein
VTDEAVDLAVRAFPGLQSLYLSYCRSISDAALLSLMGAKQLQVLDLYNVPLVSDAAMSKLVRYVDPDLASGVWVWRLGVLAASSRCTCILDSLACCQCAAHHIMCSHE